MTTNEVTKMTAKRTTHRAILWTAALSVAAATLTIAPSSAGAQTCEPGNPQDALQYLRRLSLDLRGRLPDYTELEQVAMSNTVDPALIDQMIASPDFLH